MKRFLFIRHGETDWNAKGLLQGSQDLPLNDNGIAQAHAVSSTLKTFPITAIVSSPQIRAHRTASIIAENIGHQADNIRIDAELRERAFGDYEGKTMQQHPRTPVYDHMPEGPFNYPEAKAEPFEVVGKRARQSVERWLAEHGDDDLLLFVAHGGVFSALHLELQCGAFLRIENAKPYEFSQGPDGKWVCRPL